MKEITDIERFVEAQDSPYSGYALALSEVEAGKKAGHWIWYIFPQLRGLGRSSASHFYGIAGRDEAEAYLRHPVLGPRLREITATLLRHAGKSAYQIFGGIDSQKVKSCMTLFDCIAPGDVFAEVLDAFYGGSRDPNSLV